MNKNKNTIKLMQYNKIKKRLKIEIAQSLESKQFDKAKNLCKRLDRVKETMM